MPPCTAVDQLVLSAPRCTVNQPVLSACSGAISSGSKCPPWLLFAEGMIQQVHGGVGVVGRDARDIALKLGRPETVGLLLRLSLKW